MIQEEHVSPREQVSTDESPEAVPLEETATQEDVHPEMPSAEGEPNRIGMWFAYAVIVVLLVAIAFMAFFRS